MGTHTHTHTHTRTHTCSRYQIGMHYTYIYRLHIRNDVTSLEELISTEQNIHRPQIFFKLNTKNTTHSSTNQSNRESKHNKPQKQTPRKQAKTLKKHVETYEFYHRK